MSIFQVVAKKHLQFLVEEGNADALAIENKLRELMADFQILQPEHVQDGDAAVYVLWPRFGRVSMSPDLLFRCEQTEDNSWLTALAASTVHIKKVVPNIKLNLQIFVRQLLVGKIENAEDIVVDIVIWNQEGKYA